MAPLLSSGSLSSDYFDDDPDFIQALNHVVLPGDIEASPVRHNPIDEDIELQPPPSTQPGLKRPRSLPTEEDGSKFHSVLASVDANDGDSSYMSSYTYGASHFGDYGEYMSRKRAKLQLQNAEMDVKDGGSEARGRIFHGLQIYINGWTEPSVQDLRQLIIQHGGIFHAYLDKKSLVTHIITCSLTPAKIREFKHMKVVKPDWLTESVKAGTLLPWHDFIFRPGERVEESQGRNVAQKLLSDGFISQGNRRTEKKVSDEQPEDITLTIEHPNEPVAGPPCHSSSVSDQVHTDYAHPSIIHHRPASPEDAARIPDYAAHTSNPHAERAMADPAWRAAHTSVAPDFIEDYYKNSRLHHLSTWKSELKNLVAEAQERAENGSASAWSRSTEGTKTAVEKVMEENSGGAGLVGGSAEDDVSMRGAELVKKPPVKGKGKERAADAEERVIMHCDFDSFFVSAGLVNRPHLRGKPVVVCHSQGNTGGGSSTSEIASASYEARKFGIKGGMSLQQARKLCPTVLTIPYEFQRYKQFSLQFYTILMAHADDLQAVSVDEALIDVTSSVARIRTELSRSQEEQGISPDPAKDFAEAIRAQVKKVTGCEVSIGIAQNIMLARLASRRAKPAGSFHLRVADVPEFLAPLDIDDLHGFGYSARQKAQEKLGATSLGELTKKSKATLCEALGKGTGELLYKALRGIDDRKLESDKPRKSVSCDINYGIRFENNDQAESFIYQMGEEVSRRLCSIDMKGRSLTLKILKRDPSAPVEAPKFMGHGLCEAFNKQAPLIGPGGRATSEAKIIGEHAWRLLKSLSFDPKELRGIGIQIQKLEKGSGVVETESGQAVLPFKPVESPKGPGSAAAEPVNGKTDDQLHIHVQPPSQDDDIQIIEKPARGDTGVVDLPSFSQVDMSVFAALPDDVRKELETEYQRRSVTPAPGPNPARSRSPSLAAAERKGKFLVKGTNVKRITQQLAPRNRPILSPAKNRLFAKREGPSAVKVTDAELRKYKMDPEVFRMLPVDMQREQLAMARGPGASVFAERKILKPYTRRRTKSSSAPFRRPPAPRAVYFEPAFLKQQGKTKGEKLYFTETDDVQCVIEAWVDGFREHPPNQKDVDYFAKWLVQCVDGSRSADTGIEKAVAVAKWWLLLLRRHFAIWEHAPESDSDASCGAVTSEVVGRAWWKAFREVKGKMDVVARKRFGGSLSLK
ncbi:DNA repair protein rev1 [Grifola frondosa]|uniref:DNA repair protein REV1 n=1 Tax=Grifola frondosa TaxID=5627 RepID=A0A1C7MKK6_GRIFR|nr:DNA repair protein rev1 [Grifola frondosa]